jgi:hypothetical protein
VRRLRRQGGQTENSQASLPPQSALRLLPRRISFLPRVGRGRSPRGRRCRPFCDAICHPDVIADMGYPFAVVKKKFTRREHPRARGGPTTFLAVVSRSWLEQKDRFATAVPNRVSATLEAARDCRQKRPARRDCLDPGPPSVGHGCSYPSMRCDDSSSRDAASPSGVPM